MTLLAIVILTGAAIASPMLCRASRRWGGLVVGAVPLGLGCWFATMLPGVSAGRIDVLSWPWLGELGVTLSLRLDGLSLVFALLICFIGGLVLVYATSYLRGDPRLGWFLAKLLAFMTAMLGLVLADNLILLFVFWELTSISSFLLIGFDFRRPAPRQSALQALLVTGLGGLALLAGLVLLGIAAGSFEVGDVLESDVRSSPLYAPIALLLLVGAFTKSAIFPFHFWLPNAMEAPTPVSALLHSATMVKAGVYLVARLNPAMAGTLLWDESLSILGGTTMLLGAVMAARQVQLKRILAYSTISSLGTLMMLIGLGATKAAAVYLIAHALFKGCLFLVAGTLTRQTGEKDVERLGGLWRSMPLTAAAGVVGALSMAGMFPLIGFVGKELLLKAGLTHPEWAVYASVAAGVSGALTVMAAILVGIKPFAGSPPASSTGGPDWRQLLGPVALSSVGMIAGLAPWIFAEPLVGAMIMSIDATPVPAEVRMRAIELLWPPSLATVISAGALAVGAALFAGRATYRRAWERISNLDAWGPGAGYDGALRALFATASGLTRVVQNGSLQSYVRVSLLAAVGISGVALLRSGALSDMPLAPPDLTGVDVVLIAVLLVAAVAATAQRTALATVATLGGVGFMLAVLFALLGAPDLAMTQIAVETLIVIIFVLVIFHLPRYASLTSRRRRAVDAVVAGGFGLVMAVMALVVMGTPPMEPVSVFHATRAMTEGYGRNVVNVILVDFRALDTLGEIFVIGAAAIGIYTLLRFRSKEAAA